MIQKIKLHILEQKVLYLLLVLFLATTGSIYLSFIFNSHVQAVSGVTLTDNDTTGYGLDGRDFTISWTAGEQPAGYDGTYLYITTDALNLTTTTLESACTGTATDVCDPRGMQTSYSATNWTLMEWAKKDSNGQDFSTSNNYVAWVYVSSTLPTIASSTAVAYTSASDNVADAVAPQIEHVSVSYATAGANAIIHAIATDDQTTAAHFANTGDGESEYITLVYGADVSASAASSTAALVEGNLFKFTVPSNIVGSADNTFEYYIVANDRANNIKYICNDFSATTSAACQAKPFITKAVTVSGGGLSISGKVTLSGTNSAVEGVKVVAGGFAKDAVATDAEGNYTITGLPTNFVVEMTAAKQNYCQTMRRETLNSTSKTGINLGITAGSCGFYQGGGGDSPNVIFSGPSMGSMNVPLSDNIRVGLSQPMDATSINNTTGQGNVYLTTGNGSTKISGTVLYCANSSSPGCSSIPANDVNTILFDPASNLTASTFYTLIINEVVKSSSGKLVNGNRPAGGHMINFTTMGTAYDPNTQGQNYATGGQYMPPYVKSIMPTPGMGVSPNVDIMVEFNEAMNSDTITTGNFLLYDKTASQNISLSSITLDSTDRKFVVIDPGTLTANNEYEIRIKGAVANIRGVTLSNANNATTNVFSSNFVIEKTNDTTPPTIYPSLSDNSTGVSVNNLFEFGFSEPVAFFTITNTNITMRRGTTAVDINVRYDASKNSVFIVPNSILSPNTVYTITFGTGITDLAGTALASAQVYTYTTGSADTTAPAIKEARCNDYTCTVFFTEPMNRDAQTGINFVSSTLNSANWLVQRTAPSSATIDLTGKNFTYNEQHNSVTVTGVAGLAANDSYRVTISNVLDLSNNEIGSGNTQRIFNGKVESSTSGYANGFDSGGMFCQTMGGGAVGGAVVQEGFGSFSGAQFAFGQADMAYPFNMTAGQDSNVFQVKFTPGVALLDNDQIVLTFPNGTTVTNAYPDIYSPYYGDFNDFSAGTLTFDTDYSTDGVGADNTAKTVTVQATVSGTLSASDPISLDIKGIINPTIPKGPESGGYTVGIKVLRAGTAIANKTSMSYFINQGGTNNIDVYLYAGSATTTPTNGANGTVYLWGGGPSGPMDKKVTMTNGIISAVEGSVATKIAYTNLSDGCYNFGTEPYITLGGTDYFGQMSPEPVCVFSGETKTKHILLRPSGGTASVPITVKLTGIADFGGISVDIFAGGPGKYVTKNIASLSQPNANGYTLQLPANGDWFVGIGPGMAKGVSSGRPKSLPGTPPPPINIITTGVGTESAVVTRRDGATVPGVSFNDTTDTITFTFATADKTISGTVTDGTNPLQNIEVFVQQQGFGAPMFDTTDANGVFSINVSSYGTYEIGAMKQGMPPAFKPLEVRNVNSSAVIYFKGKQITQANPLVLTLRKPAYYISGKVLDVNNNSVSYAPVFATNNTTGEFVSSGTGSDGSYTLFVDSGTWTVKSELPPDKTDTCGTFSKTVVVSTENKTGQNVSPTSATCYTLSGTISVGGTVLANVPVFVNEWDATNIRPVAGGAMRGTSTDSTGIFSVKVVNGTYKVGTWHPDYGELSATAVVNGSNKTDANVTVASTATATFAFTGGTSSMETFVELKNSTDKTKTITKQQTGLDNNLEITVTDGQTYDYFVNVFGFGTYSGTIEAGGTATINVSTVDFLTVTGTVKDASENEISGALVTFTDTDSANVRTALTDENGNYSINIKADTYNVAASYAGYVPGEGAAEVAFAASTTGYSFADGEEREPLQEADRVITGTLKDSSGTAMTSGYVWAENDTTGVIIEVPIDENNGFYSIPVVDGDWTIKGAGPLHDVTQKSGAITVDGEDETGNNFNLSADATRTTESESSVVSASSGGSVDDTDGTGVKFTAGAGVLESGSGNVSITLERSYIAPNTEEYTPLSNATFEINATGNSTIKNFNGSATISIDYSDLVADLPANKSESDLVLAYYSQERGEYVPVEGGYTVDTTNNRITGSIEHLSEFALIYATGENPPSTPSGLAAAAASTSQINLTWTVVSGATSYDIYRSTSAGGTYSRLGSEPTVSSGSTTSYSDTGLSAGTTYYYKISALNTGGESAASSYVYATTNAVGGSTAPSGAPPVTPSVKVEVLEQKTESGVYEIGKDSSIKVGSSSHILKVDKASDAEVTVTVKSNPVTVTVKKNESIGIDTNVDGVKDMKIAYKGLESGKAKIEITNLTDENELKNGVSINYGAYETDSREIILSFNVTNAVQMAISNKKDLSDAGYMDFASSTKWTLTEGNGIKIVYVKFRASGGATTIESDTIKLTGQSTDQKEEAVVECSLISGKAYKVPNSPTVWYITSNCTKRAFNNAKKYFTYFNSWKDVEVVSNDKLSKIPDDSLGFMPLGSLYNPGSGALIKVVTDPKVYLLLGANRYWVNSEVAFVALNYTWGWIEDVMQTVINKYTDSGEIKDAATRPDGSFIKYKGKSEVYKIENGKKRHVKNEKTLNSLEYRKDRIVEIADTEIYETGDPIE